MGKIQRRQLLSPSTSPEPSHQIRGTAGEADRQRETSSFLTHTCWPVTTNSKSPTTKLMEMTLLSQAGSYNSDQEGPRECLSTDFWDYQGSADVQRQPESGRQEIPSSLSVFLIVMKEEKKKERRLEEGRPHDMDLGEWRASLRGRGSQGAGPMI